MEDINLANSVFDIKRESFSNSENKSVLSVLDYTGKSMRLFYNHVE